MEQKNFRKFGTRDQVGYFFGDLAGSMVNLYIGAFFLMFATYVLGITPQWMAGLFLFAKIWDAINDPMIGSLPDRMRLGKSGDKFKPFIKVAMIPLALSGLILFADTSSWSMTMKHIWVAVGYIIYGMSYTGTSMPYGAMSTVITKDPVERTKLSRARSLGGTAIGIFFMPIVSMFIWNEDQSPNAKAFFMFAIIAGILSIIFYMLLLNLTTERYSQIETDSAETGKKEKTEQKYSFKQAVLGTLQNRPLIGIMIASIGSAFAANAQISLASYIYKEYYGMPKIFSLTTLVNIPVMLVCFSLIPKLSGKFGKQKLVIGGIIYNLVFSLILFLFPISNAYVYLVLSTLCGVGQTVFLMLVWAFVNDCIDYQEYKTHVRNDGTTYSIYTFSKKVGDSLAGSGVTFLLGMTGFISGVSAQAAGVGENIRKLATITPVIACVIQLIGMLLIYNLNKAKTEEMYAELKRRQDTGE